MMQHSNMMQQGVAKWSIFKESKILLKILNVVDTEHLFVQKSPCVFFKQRDGVLLVSVVQEFKCESRTGISQPVCCSRHFVQFVSFRGLWEKTIKCIESVFARSYFLLASRVGKTEAWTYSNWRFTLRRRAPQIIDPIVHLTRPRARVGARVCVPQFLEVHSHCEFEALHSSHSSSELGRRGGSVCL